MNRLTCLTLAGCLTMLPSTLLAQSAPADQEESGPATTTASGTTGIWYVPTAAVLPHGKWSASFQRTNVDDGQGFSDISTFPLTFAIGLRDRAELFGSFLTITRIDRDTRPLFFTSTETGDDAGTGGGILVNYPLVRQGWIGNQVGDFWLGGKVNLLGPAIQPAGLAIRAMVKLPTGDSDAGASTGKVDVQVDGIFSVFNPLAEVSAYGGFIARGSPDGYSLTNGLRWGLGATFPQRFSYGFRINAEMFGEKYLDNTLTAPAGLTGADGSLVPTTTAVKSPTVVLLGATWQAPNGFFIGAAGSWNLNMKDRADASVGCSPGFACPAVVTPFPNNSLDDKGFQVRIGFHPGARGPRASARWPSGGGAQGPAGPGGAAGPPAVVQAPPAAPSVTPAPAAGAPGGATQQPPAAANRVPTVRAACDPCTVELGRSSTVTADAQDPDGDPLTYQWKPQSGSIAAPTSRQTTWTAPQQVGSVPVTVAVSDGRGGTASATTTIQVIAARLPVFEDVHFEFDQSTLRPEAVQILDAAVTALQANPTIRLTLEGHTCNIGTPEYNLALGERRAQAVRTYLTSRGIAADRLIVVTYGEERPRHDNSREETRRMNRRTALVIMP